MKFAAIAVALLAAAAAAAAQEFTETRFTRIHLRNGNFIDGNILRNTEKAVTVKINMKDGRGELVIRREHIARIEEMRIRSLKEEPRIIETPVTTPTPPPIPPDRRDPFEKVDPPKTNPEIPANPNEPFEPKGTVQEKVDQILEQLKKTDVDRRYQVMEMLFKVGPGTGPHLAGQLERLDDQIRGLAVTAIKHLKEKGSVTPLLKALESSIPGVRSSAASALGGLEDLSCSPKLRALLSDQDGLVRSNAIQSLQALGDRDAFDPIARLILDPDRAIRATSILALASLAGQHQLQDDLARTLSEAVQSAKGEAKADIVVAIGRSGRKELWKSLTPLLLDDAPNVRGVAATALADLDAKESEEIVVERLGAEPEVGAWINLAGTAQRLNFQKSIPAIISRMSDPNLNFRMGASRTLRALTGQNLGTDQEKWSQWYEAAKPKD